jgi:hypothetical protein
VKAGVSPDSLVVAVSRVKDPSLSVRANPGPWLAAGLIDALHEHCAIVVVPGMHVGLIPDLERPNPQHDLVIRIDDVSDEFARLVALELGANQRNVRGRVLEAERRAVQRQETLSAGDKVEQRLLLLGRDFGVIRVNHELVVLRQIRVVQVLGIGGVREIERFGCERILEHGLKFRRIVVLAVVAEKKNLDFARRSRSLGQNRRQTHRG